MIYVTQDDLNDDMVIDKQPEGTKVKRTIHNKLPFALELYWVDLKGRRDILINELNAGSVFVMDSKIGHVFILRDSKGSRDIKRFVVDGKEMIYVTRDDLDRYNENDDLKDVDSDDMEENTEKEMDEELENDEDDAHENIEDGSNKELNQDFNQDVPLALTIMNHLSTQVAVYWANDQNKQGILQGYIEPGTPTHLNSAVGNKYYVTNSKSNKKIKEFIVSKDDNMIKINRDESLVVTQVYNHCDSIVHIYWIEPDSKQEIMLASMKAGSSMDLNGYHGDEYVVRDFNLKEYQKFIVDDAHGDNPFFLYTSNVIVLCIICLCVVFLQT